MRNVFNDDTPNRRLLEFQANMEEFISCPHTDDCFQCRYRRMMKQCAQTILKRTDISDGQLLIEWAKLCDMEWKSRPSVN